MTDIKEILTKVTNKAVADKKDLEFTYTDAKGNVTHRILEPSEVKGGKVWGFDRGKNAPRCFSLDNITRIKSITRVVDDQIPF